MHIHHLVLLIATTRSTRTVRRRRTSLSEETRLIFEVLHTASVLGLVGLEEEVNGESAAGSNHHASGRAAVRGVLV